MKKVLKALLIFVFFALVLGFHPSLILAQDIFWSTPKQINSPGNDANVPTVVTGPNGYLHAAWAELPSGNDCWYCGQNPGIFYSVWNGDSWSTPVKVSQNTGFAITPGIAVTSDNNVHIVWDEDSSNPNNSWGRIMYAKYNGSTWSIPVSLSESLDLDSSWAWDTRIVSDSANNLHVIFNYVEPDMAHGSMLYYTKFNGTSWSLPPDRLEVKSYDSIQFPSIAVDSSNNPHVIMQVTPITSSDTFRGTYHMGFNGSIWSNPFPISSEEESYWQKIVIDGLNNRHVVWSIPWYDSANGVWKTNIMYSKWNGTTWSTPVPLSPNAISVATVGITLDSQNNIYVGWGDRVGWEGNPAKGIQVSYKKWTSSSQSWSDSIFMRYVYDLDGPFIFQDKWDNQHFAWSEQNSVTNAWEFFYSTVPLNVGFYDASSSLTINVAGTSDTLKIPANALTTSATVSAQIGPLPASFDNTFTTIRRSYTYRPHGLTFAANKEATATIYYLDSELVGADERNLKVYIWDSTLNGGLGNWSTSFTTSVNTAANKATVTLPHFSVYGMSAPNIQTNFQNPTADYSGSTIPVSYQFINQVTNLFADPPAVRTILDPDNPDPITDMPTPIQFLDNYSAELVDANGAVLQTLVYKENNAGDLTYNTTDNIYNGSFQGTNLAEGNYTIKTYLGTIQVGSFNFHYTPQVLPSYQITFLPPLTTDTLYTMQDGSTLPFKFELTSGTVLTTQQDVSVKIGGIDATTSSFSMHFSINNSDISFDTSSRKYQLLLKTKELGMTTGTYRGEVYLNGSSTLLNYYIDFSIVNEGQAKGKSK